MCVSGAWWWFGGPQLFNNVFGVFSGSLPRPRLGAGFGPRSYRMKFYNRVRAVEARAAKRSSAQWHAAAGREATERAGRAGTVPVFRLPVKFAVTSRVTVAGQRFSCVKILTPSPETEGSLFSPRQHGRCRSFGRGWPRGRSTRRAAADSRESPCLIGRVFLVPRPTLRERGEQERSRAGGWA